MANFTFKTTKPVGKWKSFDSDYHEIKLNKRVVGTISDKRPHKVTLYVIKKDIAEDGNLNCPWKQITFSREFESIGKTKEWLKTESERLQKTYPLYQLED